MGDPPRSPTLNFHSVLGVPKSASLADIGRAYRSLIMIWHPDKNKSSNKAEAVDKFRSINEAYRALSTKKREGEFKSEFEEPKTQENASYHGNKENQFDVSSPSLSRSKSQNQKSQPPLSRNASRRSKTPTPSDFYASLSGKSSRGHSTPTTPTTPTESLSSASLSKMTSQRAPAAATLSKMMSQRGPATATTPIVFSQSMPRKKPPPIKNRLECSLEELCAGGVKKIKITRDVISTHGFIMQEEEILTINIRPGWKKGTKITFEGKGDERPGSLPADIIFIVDEKRHPMFKRLGDDLEIGVEIPLIQALTGCSINVPLLGREKMSVSLDEIIYPGYEKIISGQGMPKTKNNGEQRGDLRLRFMVMFPQELSKKQRSDIVSILDGSS